MDMEEMTIREALGRDLEIEDNVQIEKKRAIVTAFLQICTTEGLDVDKPQREFTEAESALFEKLFPVFVKVVAAWM